MTINPRSYRGDEDFLPVRDFLVETYGLTNLHHNWCLERWDYARYYVVSLREEGGLAQWESDIHLWETGDGRLVGVAHHEGRRGEVFLQIHPDYRFLEDEMMAWAEKQLAVPARESNRRCLTTPVYTYDTERQAMLKARGYCQGDGIGHKYYRSLLGPVPEPVVPAGYRLRSLQADDDLEKRSAAWARAFGSQPRSEALHRSLQRAPGYRMTLESIVEAADGSFVAFALAWFDPVNCIGMFEPVGTDPDHRRRELGKAVMYRGMRELQALGARMAYVGAGEALPANALYRSVGFDGCDIEHPWLKEF